VAARAPSATTDLGARDPAQERHAARATLRGGSDRCVGLGCELLTAGLDAPLGGCHARGAPPCSTSSSTHGTSSMTFNRSGAVHRMTFGPDIYFFKLFFLRKHKGMAI
jgi:hypothetical protein